MSVNIPNGSSGYFYPQLFRGFARQQTVCPFICREEDLGSSSAEMLNLVSCCLHFNYTLFFHLGGGCSVLSGTT